MAFELYNVMAVTALGICVLIGWHQKTTVDQSIGFAIVAALLAIANRNSKGDK